jgi:hypothetical protein
MVKWGIWCGVFAIVLSGCGPLQGAITTKTDPPTTLAVEEDDTIPIALTPTTVADTTTAQPIPTSPSLTAVPGENVSDALRLGEGGLGRARFGTSAAEAVEYVRSVLGPPDEDSGWGDPVTDYGRCPGSQARVLRWGQLLVVLTDHSRFGDGRQHFSGWSYGPAVNQDALYPNGLAMSTLIAPGQTLADVEHAFPGGVTVASATERLPATFRVGNSFGGWLTGTSGTDQITSLDAGDTCEP